MKVPLHLVIARREQMATLLATQGYLPVKEICQHLKISEATARRDLRALATQNKITRTYGGALVEFNQQFPSFQQRQQEGVRGKQSIAEKGIQLLRAGMTCYMDAGTTLYAMAELLCKKPIHHLTIVTTNLPLAQTLAQCADLKVYLLGGQLLQRQSVLLGDVAKRNLKLWKFDISLLSAQGMTAEGIWNSTPEVISLQHEVIARSSHQAICIDSTKLGIKTDYLLLPWTQVPHLITDASAESLKKAGIAHDKA